jgi:hypothetical protein
MLTRGSAKAKRVRDHIRRASDKTRGLGEFRSLALLAHRCPHRQAALTMQAVKRATTSILYIAGSENRQRSMNETRVGSPKVCFSRDSSLVYGMRRDSRVKRLATARADSSFEAHLRRTSG